MMSRIDKLRFAVACTDGWDEIVIINKKKQTIPHDDASAVFKCPGNPVLTQSCNSNLVFLCWFMPRRMEHFFFLLLR